jgi:coproporphyrinogen III oxidase-like Fe-S oxidoreductase
LVFLVILVTYLGLYMTGLYIHIPFCKQACHYCNFHFATSLRYKDDMIKAIVQEIIMRADEVKDRALERYTSEVAHLVY